MIDLNKLQQKLKFILIRVIAPSLIRILGLFFSQKSKKLLVIKNDGIGDYVLFRNYLYFLKNSEKYKHYKIYLLCNLTSKELALHFDSNVVDVFFWYSDDYFLKWKLITLLYKLQKLQFDTIIYPNYSRKFEIDWIIKHIRADHKITVDGNTTNQSTRLRGKSDRYYTNLIKLTTLPAHEFQINKEIFKILTQEECYYNQPIIDKELLTIKDNDSIVFFLGGSTENKKWSAYNFLSLCNKIIDNLNGKIILTGSSQEVQIGNEIENEIAGLNLTNQIGNLNLIQLCELIAGSKLLISNDTVAIHIAVALKIPVISISKGDLYGRFIPYPINIYKEITSILPRNFISDQQSFNRWSTFQIDDVLVEDVFFAAEKILNLQKS